MGCSCGPSSIESAFSLVGVVLAEAESTPPAEVIPAGLVASVIEASLGADEVGGGFPCFLQGAEASGVWDVDPPLPVMCPGLGVLAWSSASWCCGHGVVEVVGEFEGLMPGGGGEGVPVVVDAPEPRLVLPDAGGHWFTSTPAEC